jgi:hypothetical protein
MNTFILKFIVPRRAHNSYGDRCFAACGPAVWNTLPLQLRQPDILFNRLKKCIADFFVQVMKISVLFD